MKHQVRSIVSLLLLLVFSGYITPKEVMHMFSHHEDTEHCHSLDHDLQISAEHHHCELLKADQQFSVDDYHFFQYDFSKPETNVYKERSSFYKSFLQASITKQLSLRGPPSLM